MKDPIAHVGYRVRNLEEALKPYLELLGGVVEWQLVSPFTGNRIAFVRVGEQLVELLEPVDKAGLENATGPLFWHVAFQVPDLDATVAALKAAGITCDPPEPEPSVFGGRTTMAESPMLGGLVQLLGE